eukprot:2457073-Rhodomonas_salina.2
MSGSDLVYAAARMLGSGRSSTKQIVTGTATHSCAMSGTDIALSDAVWYLHKSPLHGASVADCALGMRYDASRFETGVQKYTDLVAQRVAEGRVYTNSVADLVANPLLCYLAGRVGDKGQREGLVSGFMGWGKGLGLTITLEVSCTDGNAACRPKLVGIGWSWKRSMSLGEQIRTLTRISGGSETDSGLVCAEVVSSKVPSLGNIPPRVLRNRDAMSGPHTASAAARLHMQLDQTKDRSASHGGPDSSMCRAISVREGDRGNPKTGRSIGTKEGGGRVVCWTWARMRHQCSGPGQPPFLPASVELCNARRRKKGKGGREEEGRRGGGTRRREERGRR